MEIHTKAKLLETCSDELERMVLEEVHRCKSLGGPVSILVLPLKHDELERELGRLGCELTGGNAYDALHGLFDKVPGDPYDIIYCRRGLCRIPYGEARDATHKLLKHLRIGGKLFISIFGMHSELAERYPGNAEPVENRFNKLHPNMAKKYGIEHPVCLYSERNLFMLMFEAGGSVLRTFTTTHGTVKGVAVRV